MSQEAHGGAKPSREQLRSILALALRAPSGDNVQPWSFLWDGETLSITHCPQTAAHILNSGQSASLLALGCLLEAMDLASSTQGFSIDCEFRGINAAGPNVCAVVRLKPSRKGHDPLAEALPQRTTDRRPYRRGELPENLDDAAYVAGRPRGALLDYILSTESLLGKDPRIMKDTLKWARLSRRETLRTGDGMTWQGMGVKWAERALIWLMREYPRLISLLSGLIQVKQRQTARKFLNSSAGLCCFTVSSREPVALVQAGRQAMRVWLELTRMGYGVQPLTLCSLRIYDAKNKKLDPASERRFQGLFLGGEKIIREAFQIPEGETPVWMLRTGISSPLPESWRTLRKSMEQVLSFESQDEASGRM